MLLFNFTKKLNKVDFASMLPCECQKTPNTRVRRTNWPLNVLIQRVESSYKTNLKRVTRKTSLVILPYPSQLMSLWNVSHSLTAENLWHSFTICPNGIHHWIAGASPHLMYDTGLWQAATLWSILFTSCHSQWGIQWLLLFHQIKSLKVLNIFFAIPLVFKTFCLARSATVTELIMMLFAINTYKVAAFEKIMAC